MTFARSINKLGTALACGIAAQLVLSTGDLPMQMRLYGGTAAAVALLLALVPVGYGAYGLRLANRTLWSFVITTGSAAAVSVSQGKPYEAAVCGLVAALCLLVRPEGSRPALRA